MDVSWTVKKAEHQRIDAFELWCWRRLLRVPWTTRRSNQSILKEISPEYSLEGLMLKLKLQCFGHMMWRAHSLEKTVMLRSIEDRRKEGNRGWDGWMASPTRWPWVQVWIWVGDGQGGLGCCSPWNSPGMGSLSLLQRIFLTQESNRSLLHCRRILYQLSYQGSPSTIYAPRIQQQRRDKCGFSVAGLTYNSFSLS